MMRVYPALYLLLFVVTGITLADLVRLPAWFSILASLVFSVLGILWLSDPGRRRSALAFGFAFLFFSSFHFGQSMYDTGPHHVGNIIKEKGSYHIFGIVDDWPVLKTDRTEVMVSIDSAGRSDLQPISGRILLKISDTTTTLQRGDRLEFRGTVYPLKSRESVTGFDYSRYLNLRGVFGIVYLPTLLDVRVNRGNRYGLYRMVDRVRDWIRNNLETNLSPIPAALSSGFLIGETRNIPPEIYRFFRDSGTLHLLAVSGSNVALVIIFLLILMRPFSFRPGQRYLILLSSVFLFTLLSYGEPSVVRASIMAALVILAKLFQRRYDLNNIIALTALIILLVDPTHLFKVGFQLSFVTAWGLILVVPRIDQRFQKWRRRIWYRWLVYPAIIALTAQLFSMPLIAYYFHRVPVLSVAANLVIVPMTSIAVFGVQATLVSGLILPILGMAVGSWLSWFLSILVLVLRFFGSESVPILVIERFSVPLLLMIYLMLILTVLSLRSQKTARLSVFIFLIAANVQLVRSVAAEVTSAPNAPVICSSVPGGSVATIPTRVSGQADLVVIGMKGSSYPMDERILAPMFQFSGIKKLRNIFVLNIQFDAVDDLLRLAKQFDVESIYVDKSQLALFGDVAATDPTWLAQTALIQYAVNPSAISGPGFYPFENNLLVRGENSRIWFSSDFIEDLKNIPESGKRGTIVTSAKIDLSPIDRDRLLAVGIDRIVCAENKQRGLSERPNRPDIAVIEIIDLSSQGTVEIDFDPETMPEGG